MALVGNYSLIFKSPGKYLSNVGVAIANPATQSPGAYRGRFYGETMVANTVDVTNIPTGYYPPFTYILAPHSGGMGTTFGIEGLGTLVGIGSMGVNKISSITGLGDITNAQLSLIVSAVAFMTGSGVFSADVVGKASKIASLAGTSTFTASVGALANLISDIIANGDLDGTASATGFMVADISPFTTLSPETLAAAVWNAIATNYNNAGTMGNKMNSAASAGDPWTTDLSAYNTTGTAGKIVKDIKNDTGTIPALL
jgi:hypothetical protein